MFIRWFLIIISSCLVQVLYAGDLHQTFLFARELYGQQSYEQAIVSYQRVLFFDRNNEYREPCYRELADCYLKTGNHQQARFYWNLLYNFTPDPQIKVEATFNKVASLLTEQQFGLALEELYTCERWVGVQHRQEVQLFYAVCFFGMEDFVQAKKHFRQALPDTSNRAALAEIDSLFELNAKINRIRPERARLLSTLFPGLGQLSQGYVKEAANSLLLNAGLVGLGILVGQYYGVLQSTVAIFPWFARYYMGGIKQAEKLAIKKRTTRRARVYQSLLRIFNR